MQASPPSTQEVQTGCTLLLFGSFSSPTCLWDGLSSQVLFGVVPGFGLDRMHPAVLSDFVPHYHVLLHWLGRVNFLSKKQTFSMPSPACLYYLPSHFACMPATAACIPPAYLPYHATICSVCLPQLHALPSCICHHATPALILCLPFSTMFAVLAAWDVGRGAGVAAA